MLGFTPPHSRPSTHYCHLKSYYLISGMFWSGYVWLELACVSLCGIDNGWNLRQLVLMLPSELLNPAKVSTKEREFSKILLYFYIYCFRVLTILYYIYSNSHYLYITENVSYFILYNNNQLCTYTFLIEKK